MKIITFLALAIMFLMSGDVLAIDLTGTWIASNACVPGEPSEPDLVPDVEESVIDLTQDGAFFITEGNGEVCGGVISGKSISMTCPGTLFYGEFKPPNTIIGVNHKLAEGVTCSIVAIRE